MKRLVDYTKILRSKNAGPLFITFDLIFSKSDEMDYVLERLTKSDVATAYGIDEKDFKDNLAFIAHNAVLDACTGSNPRPIDDSTMEKLFECTYYGTKVNL